MSFPEEEPIIVIDSLSNVVGPAEEKWPLTGTQAPRRLGAGGSGTAYNPGPTKRNVERDGMHGLNRGHALMALAGMMLLHDEQHRQYPPRPPAPPKPQPTAAEQERIDRKKQDKYARKKQRRKNRRK